MTDQQQVFVDEYIIHCNATRAAERAGYSKTSARQIGSDLKQVPEIKEAIRVGLEDRRMSAAEAAKRVSDIAETRLNDYMIVKKVHEQVWVRKKLSVLIEEMKILIERKQLFFDRWTGGAYSRSEDDEDDDITGNKLLDEFFIEQQKRRMELLDMEIELELNPKAFKDMREMQIVEMVTVDLIALAKAHGKGAIKKLGWDKLGQPTVEMYPADKAMEIILQMDGKLLNKLQVEVKNPIDMSKYSDEEVNYLAELALRNEQS